MGRGETEDEDEIKPANTAAKFPVHVAVDVVKQFMRQHISFHTCGFHERIKMHEDRTWNLISNQVPFILIDAPYKTRSRRGKAFSDYDVLTEEQM